MDIHGHVHLLEGSLSVFYIQPVLAYIGIDVGRAPSGSDGQTPTPTTVYLAQLLTAIMFPKTDTLWLFNIAMENGPFIDGLPIENSDFP